MNPYQIRRTNCDPLIQVEDNKYIKYHSEQASTREHNKSYDDVCARQNINGCLVKSSTFSLLGLHQVIKVSLLVKLNKIDKKDIILKEMSLNMTQAFEIREILFNP